MKVYGHKIKNYQIELVVESLRKESSFRLSKVEGLLIGAGVQSYDGTAYRAADRLLQNMRKNGQIEFNGKEWEWVKND